MQQETGHAEARGVEIRPFSADTAVNAMAVINTYLHGWPYTRPLDGELLAYWRTLAAFQPKHVLIRQCSQSVCCGQEIPAAPPGSTELPVQAHQFLCRLRKLTRRDVKCRIFVA